ncbi:MAG TPA: flagellar biosynthesis anti-sigma factor FlgM [Desulfuromonadales bacterium]|nr:flagellar biosynthesis anti-sigma factor FlgM [Desulfuromonadales bacterium]
MKVEDRVSNYLALMNTDSSRQAVRSPRGEQPKGSVESGAFSVQISKEASRQGEDAARLERLASIKKQLAEGSYNISGRDVAEKILKVVTG